MQAVHELGHVLAAWATGGTVVTVDLPPLGFSRTDVSPNPQPLLTAWAGPLLGAVLPLAVWLLLRWRRTPGAYLARFFAGFCLVANGVYLLVGSFERAGDPGDILRLGSPFWLLWLFAAGSIPAGFLLWHGEGKHFGLGEARGSVSRRATLFLSAAVCAWVVLISVWTYRQRWR